MTPKDQILSLDPNAPEGFTDEQRAFVGGYWLEVEDTQVADINDAMEAANSPLRVAARADTQGFSYLSAGLLVDTAEGRPMAAAAGILQALNVVAGDGIEWPAVEGDL